MISASNALHPETERGTDTNRNFPMTTACCGLTTAFLLLTPLSFMMAFKSNRIFIDH